MRGLAQIQPAPTEMDSFTMPGIASIFLKISTTSICSGTAFIWVRFFPKNLLLLGA
jgi:hypothetical protein